MNKTSKQVTFTRAVRSVGNGAMVSVHKSDLEALGLEVGSEVRVTLEPVNSTYDATIRAARRMAGRYARNLELLGK